MAAESGGADGVPDDRLIDGELAFYTFATIGYVSFVRNLHRSLLRWDPVLAEHLIVFCDDTATERELARHGLFAVNCDVDGMPEFVEFQGQGFGNIMSYKYRLARRLFEQARIVWWCDGDIVVRAPLLERVRSIIGTSDADLAIQHEWPDDVLNAGFWIARRSPAVDRMLDDMVDYTSRGLVLEDGYLNEDQTYLNERYANGEALRLERLDPEEFACGNRFYYRYPFRQPDSRLLHFNYSVGETTKKTLMLRHGAWLLDESRPARWAARAQHTALSLALKAGVNFAGEDVGMDVTSVRAHRRNLAIAAKRLLRR